MIIYKITNEVNGKVYIGQTIRSIKKRWWEHKDDMSKSELPLYRAMRKYGVDNFTIEEIDGANSKSELNYKEVHYMYKFNSLDKNSGYNLRMGGSNGGHSQETRDKISKIIRQMDVDGTRNIPKGSDSFLYKNTHRKGVKLSQETRDKISKVQMGKKAKKSTKQKMSKTHKKRMENPELRKRISQTLRKTSTLKKPIVRSDGVEFESISECARQMGTTSPDLWATLNGKRKTHKGYSFKYLDKK
jgi:group I intron endonuclease